MSSTPRGHGNNTAEAPEASKVASTMPRGEVKPRASEGPRGVPLSERYEDLGRIARGGMGDVRRVRDRVMQRTLAMKLLPWELLDSPRDRARFLHEARMTAELQHPGIVPVHDCGELPDGRIWFTMKEVRGRTLRALIADLHGPLFPSGAARAPDAPSLRRLVDLFLRACEAVAYAHSVGIVHRDLKPDNIMVGEFGEVLVLDWGLAKRVADSSREPPPPVSGEVAASPEPTPPVSGEVIAVRDSSELRTVTAPEREHGDSGDLLLTMPGEVMGTLAYMPPEQARGDARRIGAATDVYALGAALYEILTGRPPYLGSAAAVWAALLAGSPTPVEVAARVQPPLELAAVCARAMAREPGDRFADAGAMAAELRSWLDGDRRRERALAIVAEAQAQAPRIEALRAQAEGLRARARAILGQLRTYDPASAKAEGWRAEDDAERLERDAQAAEVAWLQSLRAALNEVPELPEAHEALADHYHRCLAAAEERRDARAAAGFEALLRAHDRGRHAAALAGHGALTLVTDPEGAEVSAYRYEERDRALVPVLAAELGRTPIVKASLPRGSYLLRIRAPGREEVRYPVLIGRGEHWDGVRPGGLEPYPVRLPREGEIEADSVYVPAGWFIAGGDPDAGESLPRRRLWVDALVVQRSPVTNEQYLEFLNDLVARGLEDEALAACPRVPRGRSSPSEHTFGYDRAPSGRFHLPASSADDELRWPVTFVDWRAAMRYARWHAARSGRLWRLPSELEWEKAARGVDGRWMPWGDFVEPTWARILGSHAGIQGRAPIDEHPTDVSPYGVRGMAGNVRDWCANVWRHDGPAVAGGIVLQDVADLEDEALRAARGGSWSSGPVMCRLAGRFAGAPSDHFGVIGIRLVRPA